MRLMLEKMMVILNRMREEDPNLGSWSNLRN